MATYLRARCRKALSKSGLPDLDYALNPYIGCEHGCIYCYGRCYAPPHVAERWGELIVVREGIDAVLRREVARVKPGIVGVGTISDAYQPIEEREELTRKCIEVLLKHGFRVSVQTKSSLVARDVDLLRDPRVDVGITITFIDDTKARIFEPRASPPSDRIEVARYLKSRGIENLWIFYGPVIPGVNDDEETFREILSIAKELSSVLYIDALHPKKFMFEKGVLSKEAKLVKSAWFRKKIEEMFRKCAEVGVVCKPGFEGDADARRSGIAKLDEYL